MTTPTPLDIPPPPIIRARKSRTLPMANKQLRFTCPHCKLHGWYDPSKLYILDPRTNHDRPDGRRCLKARKLPKSNPATALGYE